MDDLNKRKIFAHAGIRNPVPPAGSLVLPRMKYDLVRCICRTLTNRGIKLKCPEKKLSECKFVCHESHTDFPGRTVVLWVMNPPVTGEGSHSGATSTG